MRRTSLMASSEFLAFVDRCQSAMAPLDGGLVDDGRHGIDEILSGVPRLSNLTEQLVLEALVERLRRALIARSTSSGPERRAAAAARHGDLARRALRWLARRHDDAVTASTAAAALGVSRWHLTRVLTEQTRHGLRWHLAQARLDHAEGLIRTSQRSLKEIAALAGFRSASELSRLFQARRGVAPSTLPRSAWHEEPASDRV